MKKLTTLLFVLLLGIQLIAQNPEFTKSELKIIKKSTKLYDKKKYGEAIKILEPVANNHKKNATLWNNLCLMYEQQYYSFKSLGNFTISGGDGSSDALIQELTEMLNGGYYKKQYILTLRKATLYHNDLESVGMKLRALLIDSRYPVDTAVSKSGKNHFNTAESYFMKADYPNAIKYYKKALDSDPDYYKAYLYLGDCYYQNGKLEEAEEIFKECADSFPNLMEPIKFYFDAQYNQKDFGKAYESALRALFVYPDIGMQLKFDRVCTKLNKSYNQHWFSRTQLPNALKAVNAPEAPGTWKYYQEGFEKIREYTDTLTGVIRPNSLTNLRYAEEYCWSYMLANCDASKFEFARKMQAKGMLDCYVLFSLFHVDNYDQYLDLVKTNPTKLKKYIEEELLSKP